jgi:hypothetical protein
MAENLIEEVPCRAVLAHKAALHVRERDDNCINLPVRDLLAKGFDGESLVRCRHREPVKHWRRAESIVLHPMGITGQMASGVFETGEAGACTATYLPSHGILDGTMDN